MQAARRRHRTRPSLVPQGMFAGPLNRRRPNLTRLCFSRQGCGDGGRMKTIREEAVGKLLLRLVEHNGSYAGVILGGASAPRVDGENADEVWAKLRAEVGKASPAYFGYDGARARFARMFPSGFKGSFEREERDYKVAAAQFLAEVLPLEQAARATSDDCAAAARAFSKTNLLSAFEQARTRDVLKSKVGPSFIAACAAIANGDWKPALPEIQRIFQPHGTPSWPAATYLPYLWRPDAHIFLKPEVTRDFAERVGHRFAQAYGSKLDGATYDALLDLANETKAQLSALEPRDMIDVQSFIWVVGAYVEA